MPRSAISHDRTFCGSTPSTGASVVIAVGSSIGSTTRHPFTSASAVRVKPAKFRQPATDLFRSGGKMLTERDRKANLRSDIRLTMLEALHHRERQSPFRRGQPRPQTLRKLGPDCQEAHAARAGHPLARRAVDGGRADRAVQVTQRLCGIDHQRQVQIAADVRERDQWLGQTAVAGQRGEVYDGGRVVGQLRGGGVDVEPAVAVGGQRTHVEAVRGHDGQVRPVLAGQTGHRAFTRPAAEQGVEGVVGAGGEDHVVAAEAGQHGYGGATRIEDGRGGLGGYVPADLSFVTGVLRGCVDDGEALP